MFFIICDPFGPLWTLLDHFKQKLIFCSEAPPPNPTLSIWGENFIFVWNGPKGSRWAQKGPKWSKTLRLTILVPFGPFWTTLERWQACHVWPFLVQNRWKMSKAGQNSMKKWPFFAIILPWIASYGSETSFLLILSARDDLVKLSGKSDARKCQNRVISLTLTSWVKAASPFVTKASGAIWWVNFELMLLVPPCCQNWNQ